MSSSKYVALTDLFVSAGVRAYKAGSEVDQNNEYFSTWKEEGLVATSGTKKVEKALAEKE